jgi:hypothetical protein
MDLFASARKVALAKAAWSQAAEHEPAQDPTSAAVTTPPQHASHFFAMCNNSHLWSVSSADSDTKNAADYKYVNASDRDATAKDAGADSDLEVGSVGKQDKDGELDNKAGDAGIKRELYAVPILHYLARRQWNWKEMHPWDQSVQMSLTTYLLATLFVGAISLVDSLRFGLVGIFLEFAKACKPLFETHK